MLASQATFALVLAAFSPLVLGRELIFERDGRAVFPRRFGQEQCNGLPAQIGSACQGDVCGVLGGKTISTLLAASPECAQQDLADDIIDASKNQDAATAAKMVQLAVQFRQCEKNTPPDFTSNPPKLRNSVFCQKAPRNAQLNGLVQAQDPANDPQLFFDPATKSTVQKGSQANTAPFGGAAAAAPPPPPQNNAGTAGNANANANTGGGNANNAGKKKGKKGGKKKGNNAGNQGAQNGGAQASQNGGGQAAQNGGGIFRFAGALGGVGIPTVTAAGDGKFQVEGNASFNNLESALIRACDVQNNQCANKSNSSGNNKTFSVPDCNAQQTECINQSRASV